MPPPFRVGNLGEVAMRCRDYPEMVAFYRDVIGLELLAEPIAGISFFRIAPGYLGHTQVLALFRHDVRREGEKVPLPEVGEQSSLHHIALGIAAADQAGAEVWLAEQGCPTHYETFPWIGWRGLFTRDPDGNTVELVAHVGPGAS
jgi:catechol 2,3-dioxygenase-like lactoylglutathione lyase family enzyme